MVLWIVLLRAAGKVGGSEEAGGGARGGETTRPVEAIAHTTSKQSVGTGSVSFQNGLLSPAAELGEQGVRACLALA